LTTPSALTAALVLDATCLSHFARADRLDVLRDLLVDKPCWTTETVLAELKRSGADYPLLRSVPDQEWLVVAAARRLRRFWFPFNTPGARVQALVHAPAALRRRGVFVADYEIDAA
jgi:hypothetical protein